jgi:hypothetical protein
MRRMKGGLVAFLVGLCVIVIAGCGTYDESGSDSTTETTYESDYSSESDYGSEADSDVLAQEEWDNQEGEAWEEFNTGYAEGWESGCDTAFEGSPDGSLYDQGDEYMADDCYALTPFDASDAEVPYEVPFDPYSEGYDLGESDGCVAAFEELSTYGVLNWGEDSYDESVCP